MQYLILFFIVLVFVALIIIAFNIDIIIKKLSAIEDMLDRIAGALEKLISTDDEE